MNRSKAVNPHRSPQASRDHGKSNKSTKAKNSSEVHNSVNFKAALTREGVLKVETTAAEHDVDRRILMATMAKSGPELVETFSHPSMHEAFFSMIQATDDYIKYLKTVTDIAESALARLFLVGDVIAKEEKKEAAQ